MHYDIYEAAQNAGCKFVEFLLLLSTYDVCTVV
jgi:hypothetical protein